MARLLKNRDIWATSTVLLSGDGGGKAMRSAESAERAGAGEQGWEWGREQKARSLGSPGHRDEPGERSREETSARQEEERLAELQA